MEQQEPKLRINLKDSPGKEKIIERSSKGLEELRLTKAPGGPYEVNDKHGKPCYYLPYMDRFVSVIRLPAKPEKQVTLVTDPMDGCDLLLEKEKGWIYVLHDNYSMNLSDDDLDHKPTLSEEEESYYIVGGTVADIGEKMEKKGLFMAIFEPEKTWTKGAEFLLERGEYELHVLPIYTFSPKSGWGLDRY